MTSSPTDQPGPLVRLPAELLNAILSQLPNRDLKHLRLTCGFLQDRAHLRIDRVFISANSRNVEVFRAIADHETFRMGVTEVIWDDARLKTWELEDPELDDDWDEDSGGCPDWFERTCEANAEGMIGRAIDEGDPIGDIAREKQLEAQLPYKASWAYYQKLIQQQDEVLASGADIDAFRYGLERFPSLIRVTITPATHGFLFSPLYQTPMIRSFPYGFNYLIPRNTWPTIEHDEPEAHLWNDGGPGDEEMKNQWRGFRVITRILAQEPHHNISEFVVNVHRLNTGLNCHIFDQPNEEHDNFVKILQRPGFRHLHLSLLVGGLEDQGWSSYRNGYLQLALAEAKDLEHMSLHTNVCRDPGGRRIDRLSGGPIEDFIPLRTIFPIDKWPRLQHLGLAGFLVMQSDVMSLLSGLPSTVRSIDLSFLKFLDTGGHYRGLLWEMRDKLDWRYRPVEERPKITLRIDLFVRRPGKCICLSRAAEEVIYGYGPNPFGQENDDRSPHLVREATGIEIDEFNPAYQRPNSGI
ncbi:F-box domain, cyclin-like [Ilyonectria robusta]